MADDAPDVVIVDGSGTEHHFPGGFDPKRAAAIVKFQTTTTPMASHDPVPPPDHTLRNVARAGLDALPGVGALVGGALSTPETFGAGTVPGMALGAAAGQGLRDLVGHYTGIDEPTTPTQKAGNIVKEGAFTAATGYLMPGIASAVRAPIQTLREGAEQFGAAMPPTVRRLGRLLPSLPASTQEAPVLARPSWQVGAAAPAEPVSLPPTTGTGSRVQIPTGSVGWDQWKVGTSASPGVLQTTKAIPTPSGLSDAERAALVKQGYTPELIARIEKAATPQPPRAAAPVAATAKSAKFAEQQQGADELDALLNDIYGGEDNVPTRPNGGVQPAASHPMQAPREAIGAEKAGRAAGLSKQDVRDAVGSRLGEDAGTASMVLPDQPFGSILDKMRAMPKEGSARMDYVNAASDLKTKAQMFNMLRTLQRLGLGVGAVAPFLQRQSLLGQLSAPRNEQ